MFGFGFFKVREVAKVFLGRIDKGFDSVLMQGHAELDSLVKNELRVVRLVYICKCARLNELQIVVDSGINNSIANSLGYDVFGLFNRSKHKFNSDVF